MAVGFALAVVHPEAGNIGGGGFMVIRTNDGQVRALDYRETAPGRASRDMYLDAQGEPTERSVTGHLAAGVPGSVAGLVEAHQTLGRLPFADGDRARDPAGAGRLRGRRVPQPVHRRATARGSRSFPASGPASSPTAAGRCRAAILRQPDLGGDARAIRDQGAAGFYQGQVADLLVAEMERGGGLISHEDLAAYRAIWREPVTISYRGHTIYSMPPPRRAASRWARSSTSWRATTRFPPFGTPPCCTGRPRRCAAPSPTATPTWAIPASCRTRSTGCSPRSTRRAARARSASAPRPRPRSIPPPRAAPPPRTTRWWTRKGNAVSCTTTLNDSYGSAVTVTGAGFLLNDEMDDFATAPGKPNMYGLVQGEANAIAPGKRMLSAMTPTIVLDPAGALRMVTGTPGGPRIITMVYHIISNVIDHRMPLPEAVAAPRMHHQALPDSLLLEADGFTRATVDSLRALGHGVSFREPWGDVEAIIRTPRGWQGVSDSRRGGGGAGY